MYTKELNLLPTALLEQIEWSKFLKRTIPVIATVLLLSLAAVFYFSLVLSRREGTLAFYHGQLALTRYENVEALARQLQEEQQRYNYIEALRSGLGEYFDVQQILLMSELLPQNTYWTEITIDHNRKNAVISGISSDKQALSRYIEALQQVYAFSNVMLTRLQANDMEGLTFTVTFQTGSMP